VWTFTDFAGVREGRVREVRRNKIRSKRPEATSYSPGR
jgi:hypothetical protein